MEAYRFSVFTRTTAADTMKIEMTLLSGTQDKIGRAKLLLTNNKWEKKTISIIPSVIDALANLRIRLLTKGAVDFNMIEKDLRFLPVNMHHMICLQEKRIISYQPFLRQHL